MKEKNHFSFCQSHHYQNFEGKSPFVPESAPRHYAPDLTVRCKFLDVNLRFTDLFSKKVDAKTTIDLEGFGSVTDTIIFHATADSIKIDEILINEKSINDYKIENDKLTIFHKIIPNNKYQVKISYIIDNPRSGLQWILPNNNRPQRPIQIWTQGESEETHYWIPCFDAPFQTYPTRLNVHVPKDFQVISNGKLMEHQVEQNEEIFIWYQEKPHPSYLISLCIGKFSSYLDTEIHPGVSLTYYADSSKYSSEDLHRSFKETPQMIQFLEKKLEVNFPWAKYTQTVLEDFRGAMENTSATSWFWSSLLSKDEYAITPNPHRTEEVNFHELAHQWFGDLVVIKNFDSAFLKEGMVTYLTSCYLEEFYGKDEHYIDMYINQEDYFDEFKNRYSRPISYNKYNYSFQVYDDHTYPGGAWRFHMIRRIIGDELWWKTLNYYLNGNKHSTVESMDFIRALESTTGKNFREFFDDWIFKANIPIIAITYSFNKINGNSNTSDKILKYNTVTLKFDQKQALLPNTTKKFAKNSLQLEKVDYDKLFDLKFQISWLDENNSWHHESIHLTKQFSTAISFSVDNEPKALYINSNLDILMDYELINVSNEMYRNLAQHGQDTLARLIAVKELIVKDFVKERDTIIAVIEKEASLNRKSFQKMLDKLAETKSPEALTILKAISDKNKDNLPIISLILPRIGKFRSPDAAKYILEYINHENVALKVVSLINLGKTQQSDQVLSILFKHLEISSWNNSVLNAAITSLGDLIEPVNQITNELVKFSTSPRNHFQTKLYALEGIMKHAPYLNEDQRLKLIPQIEALLYDDNQSVILKSVQTLSSLKSSQSRSLVDVIAGRLSFGNRVGLQKILETYGKEDSLNKEMIQLKKDLLEINNKNKELQEKVLKMESVIFPPSNDKKNQK